MEKKNYNKGSILIKEGEPQVILKMKILYKYIYILK